MELYFKHTTTYTNGEKAKHPTYIRISETGKITTISMSKMTIGNPQSITMVQKGLEPSTKKEWDEKYNEII